VKVNRVVDVVPAELDCWLSEGRHAKATTPINRMIAATRQNVARANTSSDRPSRPQNTSGYVSAVTAIACDGHSYSAMETSS
jgi:hypothetical protein